ncbi:hypothetical protein [Psychromonas sp.]|uniref:hypothetical protein n=1 Tax=Psychromonas sp. TaxID=1884585 RepID=UPI00356A654C
MRIFLLLITLFASTSAFAEKEQQNLSWQSANTIALISSTKVNSHLDLTVISSVSAADNTQLHPLSESHSKSIDFAQPIRATIRASVLTSNLNQTPEYILVYQLLTAQLDVFANHESRLAQEPPPWFMNFSDNSSRLSGWKDSNSLYTSKITYHLS